MATYKRRDLEVFREATANKITWPERLKLINKVFPQRVKADWMKIWEQDPQLVGDMINDIIKADQAIPGRPGKRAAVPPDIAMQRLRVYMGENYSTEPFRIAFQELVKNRSIRHVATKTGLDRNMVHRLLGGKADPDAYSMEKIAKGFNIRPEYFLEYRIGYIASAIAGRMEDYPESSIVFYRRLRGMGREEH